MSVALRAVVVKARAAAAVQARLVAMAVMVALLRREMVPLVGQARAAAAAGQTGAVTVLGAMVGQA